MILCTAQIAGPSIKYSPRKCWHDSQVPCLKCPISFFLSHCVNEFPDAAVEFVVTINAPNLPAVVHDTVIVYVIVYFDGFPANVANGFFPCHNFGYLASNNS